MNTSTASILTVRKRAILVTLLVMPAAAGMTVLANPSSADVPDLEFVEQSTGYDSDDKGIDVTCPDGKRVLGVGADLDGARGKVVIDQVVPTTYSVNAYAYEYGSRYNTGTGDDWRLRVWAFCGNPHGATVISSRESNFDPDDSKVVTAPCPAGYDVLGSGAQLDGARGEVVIDEMIPSATSVAVGAIEDDRGLNANWKIRAYAICAENRPAGLEIVSRDGDGPITSDDNDSTYAHCPGKQALGSGFDIMDGGGETGIEKLIPGSDTVVTTAVEDWDGNSRDWFVRAYVICAND
ncbi:hypothetical protein [Nonomuraea turcica]|uniref:hypothetical protein n=1 Tax=Nonomuraea sp. G32 TaxID=3067274 RepID=UPI00273AB19A|nr:hypothetical protein [Nonomuraea sp. G32]MDP4505912.1 hypothetical protein [Nonomuraea sp. G32]